MADTLSLGSETMYNMTARTTQGSQYAITVRHAYMEYKSVLGAFGVASNTFQTTHVVLEDLNMTVHRGSIYALLGSSGCGKTTILQGIVGQHELTSGEVRVLGHKPRSWGSGIPGPTVGYMPQETSLPESFTISETMHFYGRVCGMSHDEVEQQIEKLSKVLQLPNSSTFIGKMSGGQQRRTSFAVALLHAPPVLILDEPTVGVDPLLRESIWLHLQNIATNNGITVVITTHYIEEATLADTVGLLRNGRLMAEEPPRAMVRNMDCATLEDVLLKLCVLQSGQSSSSAYDQIQDAKTMVLPVNADDVSTDASDWVSKTVSPVQRIRAVARKSAALLMRYYLYTLIFMFIPTFFCFVFCVIMGPPAVGVHISVCNQEAHCFNQTRVANFNLQTNNSDFCQEPHSLSCDVLKYLQEKQYVPVPSESEESAEEDVRKGKSWVAMTFRANFTRALVERMNFSPFFEPIEDDVLDMSEVRIAMDQSDRVISFEIANNLVDVVKRVLQNFNKVCQTSGLLTKLPMRIEAVYGDTSTSFRDFAYPGVLTDISLLFPLAATLCALLPEKMEGTLRRSMIAGVRMEEIVAAHFIVYFAAVFVQMVSILVIPNEVLQIYKNINYWSAIVIMLFLAIEGMLFGFLIAAACSSVTAAMYTASGVMLCVFFTSGMLWPLEGVSSPFREFFRSMPLTAPTDALRNIAHKGWDMSYKSTQLGLLSLSVWTLIFLISLIIVLRHQSR